MNTLGGTGLWDEEDGFYYDQLQVDGRTRPLRIRSMVGLIPLFAVEVLEDETIDRLPGFRKRMQWFLENRRDLAQQVSYLEPQGPAATAAGCWPSRRGRGSSACSATCSTRTSSSRPTASARCRASTRISPYVCTAGGTTHRVDYEPGESATGLFGGNSNWRGPIWFPVNYLLIEALERYHHFYGDTFQVECPTGSGRLMNLRQVARESDGPPGRCLFCPTSTAAAPVTAPTPAARRPALAGPRPLPRVFPRRHRPRARRQPPDRLDRAGHAAVGGLLSLEGFRRRDGRRPGTAALKRGVPRAPEREPGPVATSGPVARKSVRWGRTGPPKRCKSPLCGIQISNVSGHRRKCHSVTRYEAGV